MENWKDIPGYEGRYQVSDLGRVKAPERRVRFVSKAGREASRVRAEKLMATQIQNNGYLLVHLMMGEHRKACTVHRLVAQSFLPNPDALPEVNHKDGIKTNCRVDNLEWSSRVDNKLHAVKLGLNTQAKPVTAPSGVTYPSIVQAARGERVRAKTAAKWVQP
jgi:hypothetical protein